MQVVLGADHAGFELEKILDEHLRAKWPHSARRGTYSLDPVAYSDFGEALGLTVLRGETERHPGL